MSKDVQPVTIVDSVNVRKDLIQDYLKLFDEIKDDFSEENRDLILDKLDVIYYKMNQEEINSLEKEFERRENEKRHK